MGAEAFSGAWSGELTVTCPSPTANANGLTTPSGSHDHHASLFFIAAPTACGSLRYIVRKHSPITMT